MKELNFEDIGKRIRAIRVERKMTQDKLANLVDVNVSHISNIECNKVKVSLKTLVNICNSLDVTVDYLLENEYKQETKISDVDYEIIQELKKHDTKKKERILQIIKLL